PRRDRLDFDQCDWAPERGEQNGGIARVPCVRGETTDNRFDPGDGAPRGGNISGQNRGDERLSDIGFGRTDENGAHFTSVVIAGASATIRLRTSSAKRSTSRSGCCAVNVSRKRAVPIGTVGGLIAMTRNPSSCSSLEAFSAASGSPTSTGTIGLAGS